MSDVLFIHSFPGASDTLALLWNGFKKLECPIYGVDCVNGDSLWPEPVTRIRTGYNCRWQDDPRNLPSRLINTLRCFLHTSYERAIIAEYDTLITRKPPKFPSGLVTHRAGGQLPGCVVDQFFATPWICDRPTASIIIRAGTEAVLSGICETPHMGSPDCFLAYVVREARMTWTESNTFACNTVEGVFVEPARKAYRDGTWFLHGVKTKEQLDNITK